VLRAGACLAAARCCEPGSSGGLARVSGAVPSMGGQRFLIAAPSADSEILIGKLNTRLDLT
jgi:hypothetical protein